MRVRSALLFLCVLALAVGVCAQQGSELPPEAKKRLDSLVGKWTSQWEYLDEKGEVVGVATGSEVGRYAHGDWLVEWTTEVLEESGEKRISKAWWFYNRQDKQIYLNSVSQNGDLWILTGDPVEFTITSWPKKRADGSTMLIRFKHSEGEEGKVHAVMEYSLDEGQSWTRRVRQTLTPAG